METIIETDNYFRYPVDKQTWEIRKTTKQIKYKLQDLCRGNIFGHEEILQKYNRRCRVRALSDCTLVYINHDQVKKWPQEHVEQMKKKMRILDLDHIVTKIENSYKEKTQRNTMVLEASKLNSHDFSGGRSQFLGQNN